MTNLQTGTKLSDDDNMETAKHNIYFEFLIKEREEEKKRRNLREKRSKKLKDETKDKKILLFFKHIY
jgi:hypothetical protein